MFHRFGPAQRALAFLVLDSCSSLNISEIDNYHLGKYMTTCQLIKLLARLYCNIYLRNQVDLTHISKFWRRIDLQL